MWRASAGHARHSGRAERGAPSPSSPLGLAVAIATIVSKGLGLGVCLLAGCAAPPLGLGSGAATMPGGGSVIGGTAAVGAAANRQSFQVEAHVDVDLVSWFGLGGGVVYAQVSDDREGGVLAAGGFPYLRPRFKYGPMSLAIGLAGFGFGGGGGGLVGGIADLQLGYGTGTWSVYTGAYAHGFDVTGEEPLESSARQQRLGGEYLWPLGEGRVGVALEINHQRDRFRSGDVMVGADQWGAALKLRVLSGRIR